MELTTLLPYIGVLLCPIAMGLMMWMMNRNMGRYAGQAESTEQMPAERLAALREQRNTLEAEIGEMTRIVELEDERKGALTVQSAVAESATMTLVPRSGS